MLKKLLSLSTILASLALAGCGGGGGDTITNPGSGGGGGGGGGGGVTVDLGSGIPPGFSSGLIDVAVADLAAGGSTSLSVSIIRNANLYTEEATVLFSSGCIAQGLATVTPNPVTTSTGVATVDYAASGCSGTDTITAATTVEGTTRQAQGSVNVASPTVGSIQFVSATPSIIGLKGTGGAGLPETSTVIFKVVDSTGGPVAGADVAFTLDTSVGGINRSPAMATSGANGQVQTVVQSGTVATTVRVEANVSGLGIGTQSSELVVTTGIPTQDSMSLSAQCFNVEALQYDGVINPVTVRLADRYQNPVPDGTAVTFNAEGGSITGSCTTTTTDDEGGVCSVNWRSSNPRPADGRVTILATAIGEESFVDTNGNGFFDDEDATWGDLAEPFRDDNEDDVHQLVEFFLDYDQNGVRSEPDGLFNGVLCGGPDGTLDSLGRCNTQSRRMAISDSLVLIMSGSNPQVTANFGATLDLTGGAQTAAFYIRDVNGQPMPAGTTIEAEVTNGEIVGPSSYTVGCMTSDAEPDLTYAFFVEPDDTSDGGSMIITVSTPREVVTSALFGVID